MKTGFASRPWLIVPAVAIFHAGLALFIELEPSVLHITSLHLVDLLFGVTFGLSRLGVSIILLVVACISVLPMIFPLRSDHTHLCLWPQQTILFLMTASVIAAAAKGQFPDGVVRPGLFILSDHWLEICITGVHLAATIRNAKLGSRDSG